MRIEIDWSWIEDDEDARWQDQYCVYAYFHPTHDWLLYVGKADYATVRQRTHGRHKEELFDDITAEYGVEYLRAMHGALLLPEGTRRTSQLLSDVESLLIIRLQPRWNTQSRQSRISRPGLRVRCAGEWPFKRAGFVDV